MKSTTHTGGNMEFGDKDGEYSDTSSTVEFKKLYALKRFLNRPHGREEIEQVKKYYKFHKVVFKLFNKKEKPLNEFTVEVQSKLDKGRYKTFLSYGCSDGVAFELPEHKYRFIFSYKRFLLFVKKESRDIKLDKEYSGSIYV